MGWFSDDSDQAQAYDTVRYYLTERSASISRTTGSKRSSSGYAVSWTHCWGCILWGAFLTAADINSGTYCTDSRLLRPMKTMLQRTDSQHRMLKLKSFCESTTPSIWNENIYTRSRSAGFAGAFTDRLAETKGVCYFCLFDSLSQMSAIARLHWQGESPEWRWVSLS